MTNLKILALVAALLLTGCARAVKETPAGPPAETPAPLGLRRTYTEGEIFKYKLELDHSTTGTDASTAVSSATVTVKKRADGVFYEAWQWTGIQKNGREIKLPPESRDFRQLLSLDAGFKLAIPDLSKIYPLIEPVTDALTFYADVRLAARKGLLLKAGDHVFVEHGLPNSWAGGPTVLGRDCVNFDLTLTEVNAAENTATLRAMHVPTAQGCGAAPAPWMEKPVSDTPNNWYQVRKEGRSIYLAGMATETFDDEIIISLSDGRIISASQRNRVEGETRTCMDEQLTRCGAPGKFVIVRNIRLSPAAE
jgi:hypothetical protein